MRWKSKIVGHDRVAPDQLLAHPFNIHKHPQAQRETLREAIEEIGFIRSVTVNKVTGHVIDGHERVWQALQTEQPFIDVEYVELSEEEEYKALLTLDPIARMSKIDAVNLDAVLREVTPSAERLQELCADLAAKAKLYKTDDGTTATAGPPSATEPAEQVEQPPQADAPATAEPTPEEIAAMQPPDLCPECGQIRPAA